NSDANSTLPNTRIGTPLPKVDTLDTTVSADAFTRVNTSERKSLQDTKVAGEKATITTQEAQDPSYLLTGRKLALAHIGFLL
ncbi:408_t:CDS:1, partial [Acaulospora colombiana]